MNNINKMDYNQQHYFEENTNTSFERNELLAQQIANKDIQSQSQSQN